MDAATGMFLLMIFSGSNYDPASAKLIGKIDTYEHCWEQARNINKGLMGNPVFCVKEDKK